MFLNFWNLKIRKLDYALFDMRNMYLFSKFKTFHETLLAQREIPNALQLCSIQSLKASLFLATLSSHSWQVFVSKRELQKNPRSSKHPLESGRSGFEQHFRFPFGLYPRSATIRRLWHFRRPVWFQRLHSTRSVWVRLVRHSSIISNLIHQPLSDRPHSSSTAHCSPWEIRPNRVSAETERNLLLKFKT